MKKQQVTSRFLAVVAILSLAQPISARSFKRAPVIDPTQAYAETHEGLTLTAQLFTQQDCKNYFGTNLLARNCRPLVISITNTSDTAYSFTPTSINLPLVDTETIVKNFTLPTVGILLALSPAVFYYPEKALPFIGVLALSLWWYNKTLNKELVELSLDTKNGFKVLPYSTITKLIFCNERAFLANFNITLTDEVKKSESVFHVDLLQKKRTSHLFISHLTLC